LSFQFLLIKLQHTTLRS